MDNLNIKFIDEVATNKNQFIITYENGTTDTITLNRNAVVSQNGTPLSADVFNQIVTYCNSLNTNKVPNTRKINNKTLTTDIILNASDIGLGNVDNTSDLDKPISTVTQQSLDLKADKSDVSEVDIDLEGTGSIVSIPANATGYGSIEKLGGKSEVNLSYITEFTNVNTDTREYFAFTIDDYYANDNNTTFAISYNIKENGYYSLIFTTTRNVNTRFIHNGVSANIFIMNFLLPIGTYTISFDVLDWDVTKVGGVILKNIRINRGDTDKGFTPLGLSTLYPSNVKVVGRNLWDEQNFPQTNAINYVSNYLQTNHSWTSDNASKWLGLGVSDSNFIDYDNKKAIVKYGIVDLGTLSFDIVNGIYISASTINAKLGSWDDKFNGLSSNYEISAYLNQTNNSISINDDDGKLYVKTDTTPTGLLVYELATPIEIDLSSLEIESHFECDSGGTIYHDTIANYKYSFPVSLKGQVELNFEHDKEQQRDIDNLKNEVKEKANSSDLNSHTSNMSNPHNVTKEQLVLGNVNNTSDKDKPISTATQNALNSKQDKLVSGSNVKTINEQSIVGAGNISITESLFELVGSSYVFEFTITENGTYLITSTYYDKIYVSGIANASFYGSAIVSTMDMKLSGYKYITINGVSYAFQSDTVTIIALHSMMVYKKRKEKWE